MSTSLRYETAPPMWGIEPTPTGGQGAILRLGRDRVSVADIRSIEREYETDRDIGGLSAMGGVFLLASTWLIIGVCEWGWRTRFLIGAVILLALSFVSLTETLSIGQVRFVRLRIATRDRDVVFTTANAADAEALLQRIAAEQSALGPQD